MSSPQITPKKRKLNENCSSCVPGTVCNSKVKHLIETFSTLFSTSKKVENSQILDILQKVEFDLETWSPFIHFNKNRYNRNLIALNEKFSLFVLCWDSGQESPVHDHADRTTWVRVLSGDLEHVQYNTSGKPMKKSSIKEGEVFAFDNTVGLHKTGNNSPNKRVVSLHLYSPPYVECQSHGVLVPATYCDVIETDHNAEQEILEQMALNRTIFSNFQALTKILRKEIKETPNISKIKDIISNFQLHPKELLQYTKWDQAHYTRNLVAYDEHFTLILLCWDLNQMSPIHDHYGSSCWVKVLEGELTEILYKVAPDGKLQQFSNTKLLPDSVVYMEDSIGVHAMGNSSSSVRTVTLHCYAPPYHQCHKFDLEGNKSMIDMRVVNHLDLEPSSSTVVFPSVESLTLELDKEFAKENIDQENLRALVNNFQFNPNEWKQFAHFDSRRYTRNLLALNDKYSLMMICWHKGQRTPIHDHSSSKCWVKVLKGDLRVTEVNESHQPVKVSTLLLNSTNYFDKNFGLHLTENNCKETTAVSLHLYSPPYLECVSGTSVIPVVYCSSCIQENKVETPNSLPLEFRHSKMSFTNFQSLANLLRKEFSRGASMDTISSILRSAQLHPKEWEQYTTFDKSRYTRNLIASDSQFTLFLLCWNPKQSSPIHDHGNASSWIKILEGQLEDIRYVHVDGKLQTQQKSTLLLDSVGSNSSSIIHQLVNHQETRAITLHLYSPSIDQCGCYDSQTFEKTFVSVEDFQCK